MYFLLQDIFNGYFNLILSILAILAIALAILVITLKNPISSVLSLIGLFIVIGSYLALIGFTFVGLAYLLVYVGAVSMLFLFVLMLINIRISELVNNTKNSIPLVFLVAIIFAVGNDVVLPQLQNSVDTQIASLVNWEIITNLEHITSIGTIMYSNFAIFMFLICLILLIAMVGAIVINISPKTSNFDLPHNNIILKSSIDLTTIPLDIINMNVSMDIINRVASDFLGTYNSFNGVFTVSPEYPNIIKENGQLPAIHGWVRTEVSSALQLASESVNWNAANHPNPTLNLNEINSQNWQHRCNRVNVTTSLVNNLFHSISQIINWDTTLTTSGQNLSSLTDDELHRATEVARKNLPLVWDAHEKITVLQYQQDTSEHSRFVNRIMAATMDGQGHFKRSLR